MAKAASGWGKTKAREATANLMGNSNFVRDFILNQFEKFPDEFGPDYRDGNIWIFCPFHDREHLHLATKQSMKINLTDENFSMGYGYCFSCGCGSKQDPCPWNRIAEELGLKKLKVNEMYQDHMITIQDEDRVKLGLEPERKATPTRDDDANVSIIKTANLDDIFHASIPWKETQDWRGIKGKLVHDLNGRLIVNDFTNEIELYMPVYMEKQHIGGIKCLLEKKEGVLSYVNTKGKWSSKALFPYDYVVRRYIKRAHKRGKTKAIFLVEGPRDALHLVQNGIPAFAFLGSSTKWSDYVGDLILQLDPDLIVLAFDADAPGDKATKKAFKFFRNRAKKVIRLKMKEGTDPAQLTRKKLKQIKRKLNL